MSRFDKGLTRKVKERVPFYEVAETDWFERLLEARATLFFLRPRLKFEGATSNAPFRLMLARFNGVGGARVYKWREDPLYRRCETPSLFAEASA